MKSAIVKDGVVINTIVGEVEGSIPCDEAVGIGWGFDGEEFSPPPPEPYTPTREDVDSERDRRTYGFLTFQGVVYQADEKSFANVAGAATDAVAAKMEGALPGDFFWHGGEDRFEWIALDNTTHPMDADTVIAFARTFREHKRSLIFRGIMLKAIDPIPSDYADDSYWVQG